VTELIVAAALLVVLLTGIYQVLSSGWETYNAGEAKADMQQNARLIMEMLEADLRMLGYGYPTDPALVNPLPRATEASNTRLTFWADLNGVSQVLSATANAGTTTLSVPNAAGVNAGDTLYLINGGSFESRSVSGKNTTGNPHTVTVSSGTTSQYPQGSLVGRPRQVTYCWNSTTQNCPNAAPNPNQQQTVYRDEGDGGGYQIVAENVTGFQLRYFDSADTEISTGTSELGSTNASTKNQALNRIRRIRITFTVQATKTTRPSGLQTYQITSDVRPRNL
jgi:Tfp pilus assembly protein PilW